MMDAVAINEAWARLPRIDGMLVLPVYELVHEALLFHLLHIVNVKRSSESLSVLA